MSQSNNQFAFALHGGAGAVAGRDYESVEEHLLNLTKECEALLTNGGSALDVVETAVTELERSGMYVAGRGSAPNTAGYVELDASIMHGPSREAGAVAALPGFESPIQIARGVMEKTPHVLLAGRGAEAFARNLGRQHRRVALLASSKAALAIHRSSAREPGPTITLRFHALEPENTSSAPAAPYQSPARSSSV